MDILASKVQCKLIVSCIIVLPPQKKATIYDSPSLYRHMSV